MRIIPETIVGRAVFLLVVAVVIIQLAGLAVYWSERRKVVSDTKSQYAAQRIAAAVRHIQTLPVADRRQAAQRLGGRGMRILWSEQPVAGKSDQGGFLAGVFRRILLENLEGIDSSRLRVSFEDDLLGEEIEQFRPNGGQNGGWRLGEGRGGRWAGGGGPPWRRHAHRQSDVLAVSLHMPEAGGWLNFTILGPPVEPFLGSRLFFGLLFLALVVVGLAVPAMRQATRPITALAAAANRLGRDVNAPPLEETGPREVRHAARAFNGMQRRLRGLIEDRTQLLAAISHDLRTPITRLRLRAELMADEEQHQKMLADLDEMETMIAATLTFARDDVTREAHTRMDLPALLCSLVDDKQDAGFKASFQGPGSLDVEGRPLGLKRAFGNLIDNAVKYGGAARVTLRAEKGAAIITIDDSGPGIAEQEMERVFTPFYRVERSRSRETGGTGLGLAIVRSVIHAHGGKVMLANRPEGGLRVTVALPPDAG